MEDSRTQVRLSHPQPRTTQRCASSWRDQPTGALGQIGVNRFRATRGPEDRHRVACQTWQVGLFEGFVDNGFASCRRGFQEQRIGVSLTTNLTQRLAWVPTHLQNAVCPERSRKVERFFLGLKF